MVVALAYRVRVEGMTSTERDELDTALDTDLGARTPQVAAVG